MRGKTLTTLLAAGAIAVTAANAVSSHISRNKALEHAQRDSLLSAPMLPYTVRDGDMLSKYRVCDTIPLHLHELYDSVVIHHPDNSKYVSTGLKFPHPMMRPNIGVRGKLYTGHEIMLPDYKRHGRVGCE